MGREFFWQLNRNKKSLALNLKAEHGKKIMRQLVAKCDVLVEGFRPGVLERLGLGYRDLSTLNPGLVYASISGYGQEGSYRERAGHDLNYTALTGLLDLSAAPGEAPVMPAVQIADIGAGSLGALGGIFMALYAREKKRAGVPYRRFDDPGAAAVAGLCRCGPARGRPPAAARLWPYYRGLRLLQYL